MKAGRLKPAAQGKPLWMGPECGRGFAARNQSHACGRYDLEHHFRGKDPSILGFFDAVRRAIERAGPVTLIPEKSRIAFQVRMSFAQVTLRRAWLDEHFVLARRLPHPGFGASIRFPGATMCINSG
ncbi:MAG TPA: DUF5655 domain-containing protein [Opitutaceae bacterium]|jgi:hypothetical protein